MICMISPFSSYVVTVKVTTTVPGAAFVAFLICLSMNLWNRIAVFLSLAISG